ncbi:hypothetical protein [Pandoraea sp. NPDC087047]|uniref:hypothetical protein n=1 Tax=Pandoraea sp. NPDC087047 TaxID=3364390 RepID=UPI00381B19F3
MKNRIEANEIELIFGLPFPAPQFMRHAPKILTMPDGKIYAADNELGAGTIFVARVHADGTPDKSFGGAGWVAEHLASGVSNTSIAGLLSRDDGGVIVALSGTSTFALACFAADGQLDRTFGENGKIVHPIECGDTPADRQTVPTVGVTAHENANGNGNETESSATGGLGALVQADNGTFYGLLGERFGMATCALMRFESNGRLDPNFNGTGVAIIHCPSGSPFDQRTGANSFVVMPDGGAVVVGTITKIGEPMRVYFCRFNQDGSINRAFGEDGFAIFYSDSAGIPSDNLYQMELNYACNLSNGGITACGYLTNLPLYHSFGLVVCVDALGRPIDDFNRGRPLLFGVVGETDMKFLFGGMGVQTDGKIVACGGVTENSSRDRSILISRFLEDGRVDSSFGGRGYLEISPYDSQVNHASDLLIDSNGKIWVAGAGGPNYNISSNTSYVFRLSH